MKRLICAGVGVALAALSGCGQSGSDKAGEGAGQAVRDILIVGERVFPESLSADAAGNIYVSSNAGAIYRAEAGSDRAQPWIEPSAENGLQSLFGVLADDGRNVLWACSNPNLFVPPEPGEAGPSALKAFDLATGALSASHDFPAGPAACNDIAVADDGTVYVTETIAGRIFRLAPDGDGLELFASGENLVGVDGIAFAGDGALYINNVRQNLVQRVERAADGSYEGLTELSLSEAVDGPDGLRPLGGNRFLQSEGPAGRIALVTISGDSATVQPVKSGLDGAPAVTSVGRTGYALEGKIQFLIDPEFADQDPGQFYIRAFEIPQG